MKDVAYGLVAGAVGAFVWAAVVYLTEYEIGWIAWGVGWLVGFAVALGNAEGRRSPTAAGALAVGITVLAIVAGKYGAVQSVMPSDEEIVVMFTDDFENEEFVISFVADQVVSELEADGRSVEWPEGVVPGNAGAEADYPAGVWAEAETRWASWTPMEQMAFRNERESEVRANIEASMPEIRAAFSAGGFAGSFTPMDLIFFGLGMVTAWGVGSGRKSREEIQEEYLSAIRLAMIRVMLADGDVADEECHAAAVIIYEMTDTEVAPDAIRADAALARDGGTDLDATLAELAPHLKPEGRAMVVKAALMIALADGDFAREEQELVHGIARAVGLSDAEFSAVLSEVKESQEAEAQAQE